LHPRLVQLHATVADARAHDAPGDPERRRRPGPAAAIAEQNVQRATAGSCLQAVGSPGRHEGTAQVSDVRESRR